MPGILNSFTNAGPGGPLSLIIIPGDPTDVYNPDFGGSSSQKETALVSGGTPPYTYSWTRLSADDGINVVGETTYQPTFSALGQGGVSMNTNYEQWQCEVTDAALTVVSASFWIQFIFGAEEP